MTVTTNSADGSAFHVSITASIEIDDPASVAGTVLTDTAAYPEWNSVIGEGEG